MNKDNQFRSSLFHMDANDVLHILVIDESGVPLTVSLNTQYEDGTNNEEDYPSNPIATEASDVLTTSFTANWSFSENALGYYLDVAIDEYFTTYVIGYEDLDVGNVDSYGIVGLAEDTDYYYRIRAYNNIGTSSYSNIITLTTEIGDALIDKDGNVYTTITIGAQKWIVENLRTTTYADDAAIANITVDGTWELDTTGAYCWYDNDEVTYDDYSPLYNWYAVNNASGLVYLERGGVEETGWRVPTKTDFDNLIAALGGQTVAGGKLKEIGLAHWLTPNTGATDEFGFSLLGGGYRELDGSFYFINDRTLLWSSTPYEFAPDMQSYYAIAYSSTATAESPAVTLIQGYGLSVRLVKDVPLVGLADKDGNIYTTVTIGTQKWTVENLRTTTYADDSAIVNLTDDGDWIADTTGAYCYYDNDEATYGDDYGVLYNWYAVDNIRGLAYLERDGVEEAGWRVPTASDFATLSAYLGGAPVLGGKLKEAGLDHWLTPNTGATNETGFTALPCGYRDSTDGSFSNITINCHIWTSTEDAFFGDALLVSMIYSNGGANVNYALEKTMGYTVRLVKDV